MTKPLKIVISGASRGVGYATASQLSSQGHELHLIARNFLKKSNAENLNFYSGELTSLKDIELITDNIKKNTDYIDVLINNAGMYIQSPLEEMSFENINQLLDTNLRSHILMTRALLPLLKGSKAPIIINISSVSAFTHPANQTVYTASKAGLTAFSNSLRKELNPEKIRVSTVHPTGVNTWDDPNPEKLLTVEDMALTLQHIINAPAYCQFENIEISAV
jgi:3-oxoacyl-[acyl-carrier protein] reductase